MRNGVRIFVITLLWILSIAFTFLGIALVDKRCQEAIYGFSAPLIEIEPIDHHRSRVEVGGVEFEIGVPQSAPFYGVVFPAHFTAVINALGIAFKYWQ